MTMPAPIHAGPDSHPGLEPERCLRVYRKLTAGVSIVSAQGVAGPVGLTASSVTSVSLRPPLLLASIAVGSSTLAAIEASGAFAVQLLGEHQRDLAHDFAALAGRRFTGREHRHVLGVPVLAGSIAWSVCLLADHRRYGDHVLVIGEIVAAETAPGRPLVWHSSEFARITASELEPRSEQ